jgi:hypothetical protein
MAAPAPAPATAAAAAAAAAPATRGFMSVEDLALATDVPAAAAASAMFIDGDATESDNDDEKHKSDALATLEPSVRGKFEFNGYNRDAISRYAEARCKKEALIPAGELISFLMDLLTNGKATDDQQVKVQTSAMHNLVGGPKALSVQHKRIRPCRVCKNTVCNAIKGDGGWLCTTTGQQKEDDVRASKRVKLDAGLMLTVERLCDFTGITDKHGALSIGALMLEYIYVPCNISGCIRMVVAECSRCMSCSACSGCMPIHQRTMKCTKAFEALKAKRRVAFAVPVRPAAAAAAAAAVEASSGSDTEEVDD